MDPSKKKKKKKKYPITTTFLSINYVIISLYTRHHVVKQKAMLSSYFLRYQTESKTTVKENMLRIFCFQELQDCTGMYWARSARNYCI